jgi:hypothetical protein
VAPPGTRFAPSGVFELMFNCEAAIGNCVRIHCQSANVGIAPADANLKLEISNRRRFATQPF